MGSNIGDSASNIKAAIVMLEDSFALEIVAVSDIIKTKPYGHIKDQNDFYNACVSIKTWHCPFTLLQICLSVESAFGRTRDIKWGPRTLDIDLLLYADLPCNTKQLVLPHYDMQNRDFVMLPLKQIYQENNT